MSRLLSLKEVIKRYYLTILISLIYVVYSYFINNRMVYSLKDTTIFSNSILSEFLIIFVSLIIITYVLFSMSKGQLLKVKGGFELGKVALPGYIIVSLFIVFWMIQDISFTIIGIYHLIPIILNVTASELILKVILIEIVLLLFSSSWKGITIASIISGLLFMSAYSSIYEISFNIISLCVLISATIGALFYIKTHSILALIIWDSGTMIATAEIQGISFFENAITAIIIFFTIAIPANLICRSQNKQQLANNGST